MIIGNHTDIKVTYAKRSNVKKFVKKNPHRKKKNKKKKREKKALKKKEKEIIL